MSNRFFEVNTQEAKSSLGFDVGSHILVKADAFLPKKLSYAYCCTGVVTCVAELISVKLDPTQKFEAHCILVKPEWLENWSGQTSPSVESCTCPSCAEPRLGLEDGCGVCGWWPSKRKRSPNKKPATGSLARNVALKKSKEYSTWQYSYSVRAPETKKGWRTVKEGVPKHLSPVVADAIREGKPIREILGLLGKEPRGELSE